MTGNDVSNVVRMLISDAGKRRRSDTEMLLAINEAQRRFFNECVYKQHPFFLDTETLYFHRHRADLPLDFGGLFSVYDNLDPLSAVGKDKPLSRLSFEYRIEGGLMYCDRDTATVTYYAIPNDIASLEAELSIPEMLSIPFKDGVGKLVMGNLKGFNFSLMDVSKIVTPAFVDHIPDLNPFS